MIGVCISSKLEWEVLLDLYKISEELLTKYPYGEYYETNFKGKKVVFFKTGTRKIMASGAVQYMIDHFDLSTVILIGTCTAVMDASYGEIIIPNSTVEYDLSIREVEELINKNNIIKLPKINIDCDYITGLIGTSDKALVLWKDYLKLKEETNIIASDMESACISKVCKLNSIECIIIKGVTDKPLKGENAFDEQIEVFNENLSKVIKNILENYLTEVL